MPQYTTSRSHVGGPFTVEMATPTDVTNAPIILKDTGLAHGFTGIAPTTDTLGSLSGVGSDAGGLRVAGYSSDATTGVGLLLSGVLPDAGVDTVRTTAARAIVELTGNSASGTTLSNSPANTNVVGVRTQRGGSPATIWVLDEDGDTWQDGDLSVSGSGATKGQSLDFKSKETELTGMSGATATATSFIPAGCFVFGVTARVTTVITGTVTSFTIGDAGDADRFGTGIALAADTTTTMADFVNTGTGFYLSATNTILTATGGTFSTGAVRLTLHYVQATAATS